VTLSLIGETINIMTLGGLALAVGILVDDAPVTIENINWHLDQGKPAEVFKVVVASPHKIYAAFRSWCRGCAMALFCSA
jgi:multidrug efflux pump subunit AcrB